MQLNFNRNARQVDTLYNQLATGKRVIFPSDDPILAGRALRFRSSVTETEQYQRNVSQGTSWMEITENSIKNSISIMQRIRELAVEGASDENTYNDRKKIATEIEQLLKQLGTENNTAYAGRYVFSGFRTNEPPVFTKDQPDLTYTILQNFTGADIEVMKTYQRSGTDMVMNEGVNVIKLPYSEGIVAAPPGFSVSLDGVPVPVTVPIEITSLASNPNAYNPVSIPAGHIRYIEETGEFIISSSMADDMKRGAALEVKYDKEGFKAGELNPIVYFNCIDHATGKSYNMENQDFFYEFGVNTKIAVNTLGKNILTDVMFADLKNFVQQMQGIRISTDDELRLAGMSEEDIKAHIAEEEDKARKIMQDRFNNLIEIVDRHSDSISREHTDLGARMTRLELIGARLEEDRVNFKKLLSDNEDIDYSEAAMQMSLAETVYQAALQVGARIMQLSLADYIR
jgi:flagellar hook-associated protein 3 FlgL